MRIPNCIQNALYLGKKCPELEFTLVPMAVGDLGDFGDVGGASLTDFLEIGSA